MSPLPEHEPSSPQNIGPHGDGGRRQNMDERASDEKGEGLWGGEWEEGGGRKVERNTFACM